MNNSDEPDQFCFGIHSVAPYCYDFLQIFALPNGFMYRHRYDERWVSEAIKSDLCHLIEKTVLVTFWDMESKRLLPVRLGVIKAARRVGRICYFEYQLGNMVRYPEPEQARSTFIEDFNRQFRDHHNDTIDLVGGHLKTDVFRIDLARNLQQEPFDRVTNWGSVLDTVAKVKIFEGVEFLKIEDIVDSNDRPVLPIDGQYSLRDGINYRIRIFQFVANPGSGIATPHDIELRTFADQIQVLRQKQTAVGKYDVLTFVFKVSGVPLGEKSALEIAPADPARTPSSPYQSLYIPVLALPPSLLAQIIRLGLFLGGLALALIPRLIGKQDSIFSALGMISFVISLVGLRGFLSIFEPFKSFNVPRK